jgi:hypothetical protein
MRKMSAEEVPESMTGEETEEQAEENVAVMFRRKKPAE